MSERGEEHRTYNWPQYANKLLCDWMAFPAGSLGQFSDVRERSTIHIIDLSMQISCTVIRWLSPSLSSHHVLRFIFGNEPSKCTPGDDEAYIQWSLNSLKMLRPLEEHPPTRELGNLTQHTFYSAFFNLYYQALEGHYWWLLKVILSVKTYLVTSNGELDGAC